MVKLLFKFEIAFLFLGIAMRVIRWILFASLFCNLNPAGAASIYNRILEKALWSGDAETALDAIKNGAYNPDMNYSNFARLPFPSMQIIVKNGFDLNISKRDCVVIEVMRNAKLDENFYSKISFLLKNGADVNCIDSTGSTVLFNISADRDGGDIEGDIYIKAYKLVLSNSTQLAVFSKRGDPVRRTMRLPIDAAIRQNNKIIFKLLIDAGSPLDKSSAFQLDASVANLEFGKNWGNIGWTPLEAAVKFGANSKSKSLDTTMVNYILSKGADINFINYGRTALDFSHLEHLDEMEIFLLKKGGRYQKYSQYNTSEKSTQEEYTFKNGELSNTCGGVGKMHSFNYIEVLRREESFAYVYDAGNQCLSKKNESAERGLQDAWLVECKQRGRYFHESSKEIAIERAKRDCILISP